MTPAPTPREFFLLLVLLVSLIAYSSRSSASQSDPAQFELDLNDVSSGGHISRRRWLPLNSPIANTQVLVHAPGWTMFDNLYLFNSTLYLVTDEPNSVPDIESVLSKGLNIENGKAAEDSRLPTSRDLSIISSKQAASMFPGYVQTLTGTSFIVNDPPQFMTHYYHFCAELLFGFWRTYTALDPKIPMNGSTTLRSPDRFIFTHLDADHWRDYAHMNQLVVRSAFPSAGLFFNEDWQDIAYSGRVFKFSRALLADRSAAMIGYNYQRTQRTAASPFALPGPPTVSWWLPIRDNLVRLAGLPASTGEGTQGLPVITYISRQEWGRRMLLTEDHDRLVKALHGLRDKYGWEVNIVSFDKMGRHDQIRLAARTTIMMGVHGNGLTSLLWMKPTPRSTVIEFFYPEGFAHDYEYTTRALGMVHYGFWGSRAFTSPGTPQPAYPEGFQGNSIPIDGDAVARLCVERLTLAQEFDD